VTEPHIVRVPLGERAYDIVIGPGLIETAGERLKAMFPGRRFGIVTDTEVAKAQLPRLGRALDAAVSERSLTDARDAMHVAWRIARLPSMPRLVRAQALALVVIVASAGAGAGVLAAATTYRVVEPETVAGLLNFTIDPRTFEAALQQARAQLAQHQAQITQAEANLARDKAQHDNAVVEEDRYRRLVDGGMIAREQYDQIRTNELSLAATIKAGQAAVETARAVVRADEAAVENMRLQEKTATLQRERDHLAVLLKSEGGEQLQRARAAAERSRQVV